MYVYSLYVIVCSYQNFPLRQKKQCFLELLYTKLADRSSYRKLRRRVFYIINTFKRVIKSAFTIIINSLKYRLVPNIL